MSITVLYGKHELPAIKEWLARNYTAHVKSVSFMLYSDHGFQQAPYEKVSEQQYDAMVAGLDKTRSAEDCLRECTMEFRPDIDELEEELLQTNQMECSGGVCPCR